jgi:SAM-dependent methyltransferase
MTVGSDESRYSLSADWGPERQRLGLLEEVFDPAAIARLTDLGLGPGSRCLEIGAGGGSMTRWMCKQVGLTGSVTATDLDTRWLDALDEPNLKVMRHDLIADDFPAQSFDFIYARAVFEHIPDRKNALPRVCDWLVPGGQLYIENFAFYPVDSSSHAAYAAGMRAFADMIGKTGTDYTWARTFPQPVIDAGLADVGASFEAHAMRGGSPLARLMSLTIQSLGSRIVETGIADEPVLKAAYRQLDDPDFWDLAPALAGAWGRRPL